MALTPQMLDSLHDLHPSFAKNVDSSGLWRGSYPVSLVSANSLHPYRSQDREGADARGDSEYAIQALEDDFLSGIGLREPIVLAHNNRGGNTFIDEGHHRVAAGRRAGNILLPTVAQVQEYGDGGKRVGRIRELSPNQHGWYPKVADPDTVMRGM
jgi:hypothetical protein